MATVSVTPEQYSLVFFDSAHIRTMVEDIGAKVGLPESVEIQVRVDEAIPLGRVHVVSLEPVVLEVQGGALEDPKRPRHMSDRAITDVVGRVLYRVKDRLDPAFSASPAGAPPADADLTLQQSTAWDAYAVGRCNRAGFAPSKPRRLYHFRNRHGFNDVADQVFERLWNAQDLTWGDIEAACAETAAMRQPA